MNDKLRGRLVDGITVMSNPFILLAVVAIMLLGGWWTMDQITPLLWIIAAAYFLLAIIGGQLVKSADK